MKGSYVEGLAAHSGPESCLDDPRGRGEALTGGSAGGLLSSENTTSRRPIQSLVEKATQAASLSEMQSASAESENLACVDTLCTGIGRPRERSLHGAEASMAEATGKVNSRDPVASSPEESDGVIVPEKSANKGAAASAESA